MKATLPLCAAALIFSSTAHASAENDAKRELEGWSRAAGAYEMTCNAGKLREQMPAEKAVEAYNCFADIIGEEVTFQYPDLYEILNAKMKDAHEAYAAGQSWDKTLEQLTAASDEYNAAVAKRNEPSKTAKAAND